MEHLTDGSMTDGRVVQRKAVQLPWDSPAKSSAGATMSFWRSQFTAGALQTEAFCLVPTARFTVSEPLPFCSPFIR